VEQYGAPLAAFINRFLNTRGVELLLVGRRQGVPLALQLRVQSGAKLREKWLNYGARVLCAEQEGLAERQERDKRKSAMQVGCSLKGVRGRGSVTPRPLG